MSPAPTRVPDPLAQSEERFRLLVDSVSDYAIFMLDPDGYVVTWNSGAARIKGYRADEIIGKHFAIFYPEEKVAEGFPDYELKVTREVGRFEDEGWRVRKDGTHFWANVVITALYDSKGAFTGFAKVTRDMTERRAHEERLRQSEERFRLLVDGVYDYAIFMLDLTGHIASWNRGAERIKGYRSDEIIGKHFSIFYPEEQVARGFPDYELKVASQEGRFEDEGWRIRKDGSQFWANVVITALHDSTGKHYGFAKVTRDMTERKRVEALELAERQMFEFLAMLSHELRNPLAPISNAVYMLRMKTIDDPELRWLRDVIDRQVGQLTRLIDDLLEVSRVTSGNIRLHRERVDLCGIISRALESSRPLMDARRHTVETHLPKYSVLVDGDPTRLGQIVVNVLNNAAKYTPEGGHVSISLSSEAGCAVIRVRDNGVGISKEFLPKVFDLFTQGERTLDRSEGGLGIGLTLVRRLVEMHAGTVDVNSEGVGLGSEIVIRFPQIDVKDSESRPRDVDEDTDERSGRRMRVLVVDDNVDAATSMMLYVRRWGHDVRVTHDGLTTLEIAKNFRPDVILLDIGLPGLDGYTVAEKLKEYPELKHVVLVAVTGYGQSNDRNRSREAGFMHHFVKPVDPENLKRFLDSIVLEK